MTFKENCSDTRNSQVFSLVDQLIDSNVDVHVADPLADPLTVSQDHGVDLVPFDQLPSATAIIIAVPHKAFGSVRELTGKILQRPGIVVDVKSAYRDELLDEPYLTYWSL